MNVNEKFCGNMQVNDKYKERKKRILKGIV